MGGSYLVIFFNVVATVDVLTANNNNVNKTCVKLVET